MQEVRSALVPGTLVQARGERWHVRDARHLAQCALVILDAAEAVNPQRSVTLLLPFDRLEPAADGLPARRRRQAVVRGALDALSQARPPHSVWTARGARVDLLPWQLSPALAVLGGVNRLLLADAVGLGKTIQAGLVLAELRARGLVERALILAPAALRGAWAVELTTRFDLPVAVLDLPAILDFERTRAVGANPWRGTPVIVSSLDLVKRADVLLAVERVPLDLLIVDEAHHATPGTDRHAAVSRLARQVPWVVVASATPHSGDAAAYRALLALGEVGSPPVDRLRVFRRSHGDVRFAVARRTHILRVRTSVEEQRLLAAVLAYVRELCRSPGGAMRGVQLLAGVLARRATSSPMAVERTLVRRLEGLTGAGTAPTATPPLLPWEEVDEEAGESWLSLAGFADAAAEGERVRELVRLAEAAGSRWSKGARLQRLVRTVGEPLIVFSEFRDSLDACRSLLEPLTSLVCLHGAVDVQERRARIATFVEGRARVLLATDVAGEGLNLQAASRLVITLEWPWSPLRIEQRVGRVHRLGQTRTVHAIHLTARQSYRGHGGGAGAGPRRPGRSRPVPGDESDGADAGRRGARHSVVFILRGTDAARQTGRTRTVRGGAHRPTAPMGDPGLSAPRRSARVGPAAARTRECAAPCDGRSQAQLGRVAVLVPRHTDRHQAAHGSRRSSRLAARVPSRRRRPPHPAGGHRCDGRDERGRAVGWRAQAARRHP